MSDIDTAVVDSLKVLDPRRPIREADIGLLCLFRVPIFFSPFKFVHYPSRVDYLRWKISRSSGQAMRRTAIKQAEKQLKTATSQDLEAPQCCEGKFASLPPAIAGEDRAAWSTGWNEALEQQSATSEVLRVIASSPTEIQPVLDAIVTTAARLLDVADAYIMRVDGQLLRAVAMHGSSPQWAIGTTRAINRDWVTGRAVVDRTTVRVRDLQAAQSDFPEGAAYAKQYGHRTTLATPLLREGNPIEAFL